MLQLWALMIIRSGLSIIILMFRWCNATSFHVITNKFIKWLLWIYSSLFSVIFMFDLVAFTLKRIWCEQTSENNTPSPTTTNNKQMPHIKTIEYAYWIVCNYPTFVHVLYGYAKTFCSYCSCSCIEFSTIYCYRIPIQNWLFSDVSIKIGCMRGHHHGSSWNRPIEKFLYWLNWVEPE